MMNYLRISLFTTLSIFLLASCQQSEYRNVVPKNATAVVAVDLKSLFSDKELSERFSNLINSAGVLLNGSPYESLSKLLTGEQKIGIDFSVPFYLFTAPDVEFGATFKVDDESLLDEFLNQISLLGFVEKPIEKDGMKWSGILNEVSLGYDSHELVIASSSSKTQARKKIKSLMASQEDETFVSTEKFKRMEQHSCPFVYYANGGILSDKRLDTGMTEIFSSFLPEGVRPVDTNMVLGMTFKKGRMDMNIELFSPNKKIQKLLEKEDGKHKRIKGDFINAPNDFFIWMSMGAEGESLLKALKNCEDTKRYIIALDRAIDIQKIIQSINGDLAVVIPTIPSNDKDVDFVLTAKIDNTDFLKDVGYWNETMKDYGLSMTETAKNNYILHAGDNINLNWGVDGGDLYFASENSMFKSAFTSKSSKLEAESADIKKSILYAYINMDAMSVDEVPGFSPSHYGIDKICIKAENTRTFTISLSNDTNNHFLVNVIDNLLREFRL